MAYCGCSGRNSGLLAETSTGRLAGGMAQTSLNRRVMDKHPRIPSTVALGLLVIVVVSIPMGRI
jgi:hypothetical protein